MTTDGSGMVITCDAHAVRWFGSVFGPSMALIHLEKSDGDQVGSAAAVREQVRYTPPQLSKSAKKALRIFALGPDDFTL